MLKNKMMKIIITVALIFFGSFGFAQTVTPKLKEAFKQDYAAALFADLKEQKALVNDCFEVEGSSYSLLALSIRMERTKIFNALIENKVDLNKVCSDKNPLMYAAKYGQLEMAKALVKAGADLKLVNKEGKTALDYAVKYEKKELETYFLSLKTSK
jgi:ankyrin repeat protein